MMQAMVNSIFRRLLPVVLIATSLGMPCVAAVRADIDRNPVYIGDTVTLIIETNNPTVGEPDLSALQQDFEILGTGTSSSFSMVNGRSSSQRTWRVRLRPRRIGDLEIPTLRLGNEQTRALAITVKDVPALTTDSGTAPAMVELSIDTAGPVYVQQQVPLTLRLYQDSRVVDGTLEPVRVADAVVEPLGLERRYSVTRNGRQYRVSERRYAVAAERRGLLQIPALDFRGKLAPRQPGSGGVQPFRVSSEPLTIDVQPPATSGDSWLPAQQLTVHDSWSDSIPTLRRGEPVDRVISIQVTGLNGVQLPVLELTPPSGARIYPGRQANDTRSDSNTLYGISRQTFTYVPGEEGTLRIPKIAVDWWNTSTQQPESAQIDALTLNVMPGARGADPADRRLVGEQSADVATRRTDARGIPWWLWPLIGVGVLLAVVRFRPGLIDRGIEISKRLPVPRRIAVKLPPVHDMSPSDRPEVEPVEDLQRARRDGIGPCRSRLEDACQRNDPQAAALALQALGRLRWPERPPTNLRDLATRLSSGRSEIEALDQALYGTAQQSWDGAALRNALTNVSWQPDGTTRKGSDETSLPPLYPHKT